MKFFLQFSKWTLKFFIRIVSNDGIQILDCQPWLCNRLFGYFFAKLYKLKIISFYCFKPSILFIKSCITFDILNSNAFLGKSISKRSRAGLKTLLFLPLMVDYTPRIWVTLFFIKFCLRKPFVINNNYPYYYYSAVLTPIYFDTFI